MSTTSRSLQRAWNTAWTTAPPPSCATLRNSANTVAWGLSCVFAAEDSDPLPFSINTACMPWVTSNIYPSPSAFYSPATACPASWTAVATQTASSGSGGELGLEQWIGGETALLCCPNAFEGDGGRGCRPRGSGEFVVTECGEADAEENEVRTYAGGAWPVTATASVEALEVRWQASDTGRTASSSVSETGAGGGGSGSSGGGLSTGATAVIATVIPLVFLVGALAAFLLWRRRKNREINAGTDNFGGEEKNGRDSGVDGVAAHAYQSPPKSKSTHLAAMDPGSAGLAPPTAAAATAVAGPNTTSRSQSQHETPEWNAELDASEAERQRLVSPSVAPVSAATDASEQTSELGGLARVQRKPIAPVEIDSREIVAEVGDAYIPYRPGGQVR
ncbi:hypothetical protein T440DRAFT_469723 [Plenodomus tracheiphilus IPT5]|uniref:Uncharacterized protein n=1 Tax=Plenodomus tracheiphilus IPT5 TaxID=1408161 RepID=A0A6A7B3R3_9PLEO|nr:hypothetical protein T440DRAFT_469723 [Plenodomus tracheiphilus IPT5]